MQRVLGDIDRRFTEKFGMTFAKNGHAGVPDVAGTEVNQHPGKPHALDHFHMSSHLERTPRPPNFI